MNLLTDSFLKEFIACALQDRDIFLIGVEYLKFQYIPVEAYKKIWQQLVQFDTKNKKLPSISILEMELQNDKLVLDALNDIDELIGVEIDSDLLLISFETYIKNMKFIELQDTIVETYNKGDRDRAMTIMQQGSKTIEEFTLKPKAFKRVFSDFEVRHEDRKNRSLDPNYISKIPLGIDEIDNLLFGGPELGEIVLFTAESGIGKSQALIHTGISAARRGFNALHCQAEGTEKQLLNRYDAAWTGSIYHDLKIGYLEPQKLEEIKKFLESSRGEIFVEAYEGFRKKTISDIRRSVKELKKQGHTIHVIIIDYLELFEPGDGKSYSPDQERHRQQAIARALKELAMETNTIIITATQASAIDPKLKADTKFVLTSYSLSEDKGKTRPFDIHITLNQSPTEKDLECLRLYMDKLREYKSGQVVRIYTNYACSRFYDHEKTMKSLFAK